MELNRVEKFSVELNLQIVTLSLVEYLQFIVCRKIFRGKTVQGRNQAFRGKLAGNLLPKNFVINLKQLVTPVFAYCWAWACCFRLRGI